MRNPRSDRLSRMAATPSGSVLAVRMTSLRGLLRATDGVASVTPFLLPGAVLTGGALDAGGHKRGGDRVNASGAGKAPRVARTGD